jgi:predicted nuclease of predicted toxin-antitoxin system
VCWKTPRRLPSPVRVLLDEHLPGKLARELTGHEARGVREMGWGALQNGALLRQAANAGFGALLTMDKRMPDQQNLAQIGLAIVIIRAQNSRLVTLKPLVADILSALGDIQPGQYRVVGGD